MTDDRTTPSDTTRAAERAAADAAHEADRAPSAEEDQAAEAGSRDVDLETTAAHEREMAERGAHQRGEGRV